MRNCILCDKNPADKTGSHIVPHFLTKRIDNEVGSHARDKELGFRITQDTTESYFGSAVLPEKLEEVYGEVTEEIIENNNIDGIVDNYFCTNCENRFGEFENEYAKSLTKSTSLNKNYVSEKRPFLGFLFWTSIIWRLSIQDDSGFKLKPQEEKKLGRILNKYLVLNIKELTFDKNDSDLSDIGYKIVRSPKFSDKFSTWLHCSPYYERPYSLIIDEYLVFLYFKKSHLKGMVQDFYGSEEFKSQAIFNTPFTDENIFGIEHEDYKIISQNIALFGARKRIENLSWKLDMIHQRLGGKGKQMYPKYKSEIMKRITNSEEVLAKKGTTEEYIKIIIETINELQNT
ncbi:hypothetical protein [Winogradskyella ursingii]|uniref:hypothetical protein n=1 Tax=Winogradskyella ursingii TaxID=2686079 RepID=UPI0015CB231B|nr:hypothetical protein [Winogradskyella ursingii]